jgi:hypothetical protein
MVQDGLIKTKDNEIFRITNNKRKQNRNINIQNEVIATNDEIESSNDIDASPKKKPKIFTTPIYAKKTSLVANTGRKPLELVKSLNQENMVIINLIYP